MTETLPNGISWGVLAGVAREVRRNAHVLGATRVGAAALSASGQVFGGCNVEHRFRSHDIHAEVNAIGSMVAAGETDLVAILVVADRDRFTPCGACLDWIFEFGGAEAFVAYQKEESESNLILRAADLMPYYPR